MRNELRPLYRYDSIQVRAFQFLKAEFMTRDLHALSSWRFHRSVYFYKDFGAKLEYLLTPTSLLNNTYRPKNGILTFIMIKLSFHFLISSVHLECAYRSGRVRTFHLRRNIPVREKAMKSSSEWNRRSIKESLASTCMARTTWQNLAETIRSVKHCGYTLWINLADISQVLFSWTPVYWQRFLITIFETENEPNKPNNNSCIKYKYKKGTHR